MKNYANPASKEWYKSILSNPSRLPFYYTLGGVRRTLPTKYSAIAYENDDKRETATVSFEDGTLSITLILSYYEGFGVCEWTVRFTNNSDNDSEILEDVHTSLSFNGENPRLCGILGDHGNQYRLYSHDLTKDEVHFTSDSGRPTHVNFPYFNLEYGSCGAMLAIGWSGTWTADFAYDGEKTNVKLISTNGLRTYLKPNESIRTALFVVAPYTVRDESYATNYWRRWFVECNLPKNDSSGDTVRPFSTCCISNDTGLPNSDGSISERYFTWRPSLEKMIEEDAKVDVRWFDAGWYTAPDLSSPESDWWGTVGTWELDHVKWPKNTFRESTDFAREHGMRTMMWFEPERVTDVENLSKNFGYDTSWAIKRDGIGSISNNIGIKECYDWTVRRICKVMRENRVEIYREDNNSDPGSLWKYLDTLEGDDRAGITECKFIDAHYNMWDDIINCTLSFGGSGFVDSCASGGGRNDLESLRRGIPLLRSDSDRTTTALRLSMSWGFNKWIPFCGANTKEKVGQLDAKGRTDPYTWRVSYLPALNVDSQFVQDKEQDFSILRFGLNEWKKLNKYLLCDFYTLTPWHSKDEKDGFTAFAYVDDSEKRGIILAFRQEDCEDDTLNVKLPFADKITFTDEDTGETWTSENGDTSFKMNEKRTARLIWVDFE